MKEIQFFSPAEKDIQRTKPATEIKSVESMSQSNSSPLQPNYIPTHAFAVCVHQNGKQPKLLRYAWTRNSPANWKLASGFWAKLFLKTFSVLTVLYLVLMLFDQRLVTRIPQSLSWWPTAGQRAWGLWVRDSWDKSTDSSLNRQFSFKCKPQENRWKADLDKEELLKSRKKTFCKHAFFQRCVSNNNSKKHLKNT